MDDQRFDDENEEIAARGWSSTRRFGSSAAFAEMLSISRLQTTRRPLARRYHHIPKRGGERLGAVEEVYKPSSSHRRQTTIRKAENCLHRVTPRPPV